MKKALVFIFASLVLSLALSAYGFKNDVISVFGFKKKDTQYISFNLKPGYGIQKKAPHNIELFKLSKLPYTLDNLQEALKQAKPIKKVKTFAGTTAREDNQYFSRVKPIRVRNSNNGFLAVRAKVFYCSFAEKFCSVSSLTQIID